MIKSTSKRGRPSLDGLRHPCGRLKPESKQDAGSPPAQIKRLFDEGLHGVADPRFGTVLGLLYMHRKITSRQYAAAEAYAKLRGRFDRATLAPRRFTQSPSYGDASSHVQNRKPLSEKAYVALVTEHTALLVEAGHRYPLLERACVDDNHVADDELRTLRLALDGMAEWFGIGE